MIKNKIPLPRDRGAWQGPEMSFPILSFRCAARGARRETMANICDAGAAWPPGSSDGQRGKNFTSKGAIFKSPVVLLELSSRQCAPSWTCPPPKRTMREAKPYATRLAQRSVPSTRRKHDRTQQMLQRPAISKKHPSAVTKVSIKMPFHMAHAAALLD